VAYTTYGERRFAAFFQGRLGPNRAGPLGLLQPLADGIKFMFKEDFVPRYADRFLYRVAPLVAFVPADNQFVFNEVNRLLERLDEADIVSGYRVDRQDSFIRKFNALGWNMVVRLLFGSLCRDIDCGFKLFRREIVDRVNIVSDGAMIDTEFLAGAKARGYRIVDVPVTHLPRVAGEATGANFRVVAKAFYDLVRFRKRLSRELREERR